MTHRAPRTVSRVATSAGSKSSSKARAFTRLGLETLESRLLMTNATFFPIHSMSTSAKVAEVSTMNAATKKKAKGAVATTGTKSVTLSIGSTSTANSANGLGINIGSMNSYGGSNAVDNWVTLGGSFELANGRETVAATTGSTSNTLVIASVSLWNSIGMSAAVGQQLVCTVGANINQSYTITSMVPQYNSSGVATGNAIITISGSFHTVPVSGDSFYVNVVGYDNGKLADSVSTSGNATVARDNTTAYAGSSSAAITLGSGTNNVADMKWYYGADTGPGKNILQKGHTYTLSFWAIATSPATATYSFWQNPNYGGKTVTLTADGQWHQYSVTFTAASDSTYSNATLEIKISGSNTKVNLDVVKFVDNSELSTAGSTLNQAVENIVTGEGFTEVRFWHAELRYASLDNLIGNPDSRPGILQTDGSTYIPQLGIPEMLEMAAETHTALWIVIPTTWSAQEMQNFMDYLGGSTSTVYGAKRAADGHPASWFSSVSKIYIEAGNESWNGTFAPNSYSNFDTYFSRAENMFSAVKSSAVYSQYGSQLKLIANGWQWVPWFTEQALAKVPDADAVDVSSYTGGVNSSTYSLNDILASAMSEQLTDDAWEYPTAVTDAGKSIYVYEENAGELNGSITSANESAYATSLGAGLETIRNAMVLERDYGISVQNLFQMFQYGMNEANGLGVGHYGIFQSIPTAGTNPRPIALAAKLFDQASGNILSTSVSKGWTVDSSSTVAGATTTQAADSMVSYTSTSMTVMLFNDTVQDGQNTQFSFTLPSSVDGKQLLANWAKAGVNLLSGAEASSNNETSQNVVISKGTFTRNKKGTVTITLPAHSMATLTIPITLGSTVHTSGAASKKKSKTTTADSGDTEPPTAKATAKKVVLSSRLAKF